MRTLLCLRFKNADSARKGWEKLLPLLRAPAYVTGPWFLGRSLRPVEGFPGADTTHTTFRHEGSIAGYAAFAILGLVLAGYYGDHSAPLSGLFTYGLGFVAFGVCGWLLGALFGATFARQRLARAAALLSQGELIMIVGCKSSEKEAIKTLLYDLGGVGIDEYGDFLPHLRFGKGHAIAGHQPVSLISR
ncbi:hypothetical protein [Cupriavidus necator]|uniref:hypothetical protein n=1 Tax=Cupriavidus necator TaxID=106590 RepID=UPI0005B3B969|nr:hypothetical protein [Cupriavidus necator]